jgi:hypothetical protein
MAALGAQYPRFGYRRIRIFLEHEGHAMSGPIGCGGAPGCRCQSSSAIDAQ